MRRWLAVGSKEAFRAHWMSNLEVLVPQPPKYRNSRLQHPKWWVLEEPSTTYNLGYCRPYNGPVRTHLSKLISALLI